MTKIEIPDIREFTGLFMTAFDDCVIMDDDAYIVRDRQIVMCIYRSIKGEYVVYYGSDVEDHIYNIVMQELSEQAPDAAYENFRERVTQ